MNVLITEWFVVKSLGAGCPGSTALVSVYRIGFLVKAFSF